MTDEKRDEAITLDCGPERKRDPELILVVEGSFEHRLHLVREAVRHLEREGRVEVLSVDELSLRTGVGRDDIDFELRRFEPGGLRASLEACCRMPDGMYPEAPSSILVREMRHLRFDAPAPTPHDSEWRRTRDAERQRQRALQGKAPRGRIIHNGKRPGSRR